MSSKIFIFLSGYPGSGKTTFADSLTNLLSKTSKYPVRKYNATSQSWKTRSLTLVWCCLRHCWLLMCLILLIQSGKGPLNACALPRSLRDAVRIVFSHYSLNSLQRIPAPEILLIDEPPWHQLWIKLSPTMFMPSKALFKHVVEKLVRPNSDNCIFINLNFSVPIDICINRFLCRNNEGSRFNKNSSENTILNLKSDVVYPMIQNELKNSSVSSFSYFDDAQNIKPEELLEYFSDIQNDEDHKQESVWQT